MAKKKKDKDNRPFSERHPKLSVFYQGSYEECIEIKAISPLR